MIVERIFFITFWIFVSYYWGMALYYLFLGILAFREDHQRTMEDAEEDYETLAGSSFTLPVSVIIPAGNEETWIAECVRSVLALRYPEFELIVVDDGSTDRTLEILKTVLDLKAVDLVYEDRFHAGAPRSFFRSPKYPNVTVLSKEPGLKKAGAVNAGLNLARYKYVCVIDADILLESNALLKVMAHVEKDPQRVVGAGSYFGLVNALKIRNGRVVSKAFLGRPLIAYQNLEYIRAFIGSRIAWSRLNCVPIVSGAFGVWRRDVFQEIGGYDPQYSSEDLEFTFRAFDYICAHPEKGYKILMLPYIAGWTEGPENLSSLLCQRSRWQRTTHETVWKYRRMLFNPRYGLFAFLVYPYFLLYESLGVFFEVGSWAVTLAGWAAGLLDFRMFVGFLVLMVLYHMFISFLSIFIFTRNQRFLSFQELGYLMWLSMVEFFWYKGVISLGKVLGAVGFLRGVRTYDR